MYTDYPTVYESNVNFDYIYIIIIGVIVLLILLLTFISLSKIFKKANRSAISAWIPFYNTWILIEIANKPKYYFILTFIPLLSIVANININIAVAKAFKKNTSFALGMSFLPFVFLPILAFGKNEYFGINIIAMQRKNITNNDIQLEDNKKKEIEIEVHNQKDENLKNINISIGGGVYQKKYTNDLLQVDEKQAIIKETPKQVNPLNQTNNTIQNVTTNPVMSNTTNQQPSNIPEMQIPNMINSVNNNVMPTNNLNQSNIVNQNVTTNPVMSNTTNQPTQPSNIPEMKMPNMINPVNNTVMPANNLNQSNAVNQNVTNNPIVTNNITNQQQSQTIPTPEITSNTVNPINNNQIQNNLAPNRQENGFVSCPKCGTKVNATSKKCFLCGQLLN